MHGYASKVYPQMLKNEISVSHAQVSGSLYVKYMVPSSSAFLCNAYLKS